MAEYRAPRPISVTDDLADFQCGEVVLDDWLRKQAIRNDQQGASRTYVVCDSTGQTVVAYYALAAGAVMRDIAPTAVRRNMPNPFPVMILGRLAVDSRHQRKNLGTALLRDAIQRTVQAADILGIRAIVVHAISYDAAQFYKKHDFKPSPIDSNTMFLTLNNARLYSS